MKYIKLAGGSMLDTFGDFVLIDNLVQKYHQYNHDDIFNLEIVMVQNMILLGNTNAYIESTAEELQRKAQK